MKNKLVSRLMGCLALAVLAPVAVPAAAAERPAASAAKRLTLKEIREHFADGQSKYLDVGGVNIHYKDEGSGPPILLVHGSMSSLKTWDGTASYLVANGYRVIRYDLPGFGLSDGASDEAVKALEPTDLPEALLAKLGIGKITVVGVSSGGTLGVQLAAKRPDLVTRLVISNAPSDPLSWSPPRDPSSYPQAFTAAQAEHKRLGYRSRAFWDAWFDYYAGVPSRYGKAFKDDVYTMMLREEDKNILHLIAKVENHEFARGAMNAVKAPTLLLWGGADPLLPVAAMNKLESYLTGATVSKMVMMDVGHYPPLEIPTRYGELVKTYIEKVQPDLTSEQKSAE